MPRSVSLGDLQRITFAAVALSSLFAMDACESHRATQSQSALVSSQSGRAMQAPRAPATFRSDVTGDLTVLEIFGDTSAPWAVPPKRLTLVFMERSKAALLSRLVKQRTVLPRVVIDDAGDGEVWRLVHVEAAQYSTRAEGYAHTLYPTVTFKIETAHLRCGPPTCQNAVRY